ncbi:glutamate carboxypeptidase [Roseateles sp. YR242]|uniref:glutamate carboxypeptidase n=1 Tax=Roseateles sp. YR242 TaxID=1855305 RepID=UPI0008BA8834|nr:glutamate carboxypeptidase [Roseateles sp. YR242]SEK81527.1 glutamate carboxypeptidase [Roseateles sp. YR242]
MKPLTSRFARLLPGVLPSLLLALSAISAHAQTPAAAVPLPALQALAAQEQPALLKTLQQLVEIESGSSDRQGLDRIAAVVSQRLKDLGGEVTLLEPGADLYRMFDTPEKVGPMVLARFKGCQGRGKVLLIAHMDTVYPRGMLAQQPFRIEGQRAYGLGIADDKQGVATILHVLAMLKATGWKDCGEITVLINGDEEISSPASRHRITQLGGEHDAVLSFEGGGGPEGPDILRLATSGIGAATLSVKGRASHAGAAPERGVNALYELSHQVLQARDLSDPKVGRQVHWTVSRSGVVRNMIPPTAEASADVRVERVEDFDLIEAELRKRIQNRLLPESEVSLSFERRRPPLHATPASRALGATLTTLAAEQGLALVVRDVPTGGGTDAAFAAAATRAPVVEGLGVRGFGAHSNQAEFVQLDSIAPKLVLVARALMALGAKP